MDILYEKEGMMHKPVTTDRKGNQPLMIRKRKVKNLLLVAEKPEMEVIRKYRRSKME